MTPTRTEYLAGTAHSIVLADVFPEPAELLRPEFTQLIERGVDLVIMTYAPFELDEAVTQMKPQGRQIQDRWPAQWLNLVVDGEHSLISVLQTGTDEVIQSFWTSSPSLAYVHHSGLLAEIAFSELEESIDQGRSATEMNRRISRYRKRMGVAVPGYHRLFRKLGLDSRQGAKDKENLHD